MSPWAITLMEFWTATASHLWQSTLVLILLGLLALTLRKAPGRIRNGLWQIGLVKMAVPFSLFGWSLHKPGLEGVADSPAVVLVSGILNPTVLSNPPAATGIGATIFLATITALWATTAIWLLVRSVAGRPPERYRQFIAPSDLDPAVRKRFITVLERTGIKPHHVKLLRNSRIPGVAGFLRPRIHISVDVLVSLQAETLQAVLLHEDAHRRRYEPLRYGIQRMVFCLFFYFPPLWILLRQLHDSAELACDEAALDQGTSPDTYLAAFRKVVALDLAPATTLAAMAGGRSSHFARRFSHIRSYERKSVMLKHRIALLAGVAILSLSFLTAGSLEKNPAPLLPGKDGVTTPIRIADSVVQPIYPETARKSHKDGMVIVKVVVLEDGMVDQLKIMQEDPKQFGFGDAAMEAIRQWRYEPALKAGKPVAVYMMIHVDFKLDANKPAKEPPVS